MSNMHITKSNRGSGMVLGFVVLTLVFALAVSFIGITTSSLIAAKRDSLRIRALACAEAGIDKGISQLMSSGGTWRNHPSTNPDEHSGDNPLCIEGLASGETFKVCARSGSGITDGKIIITSTGTVVQGDARISRTLRVVVSFRKENVNVWNNAIFGGVGQTGRSINGNVQIRGSIHLLGDGENYTDLDGDGNWDDNESYTDSNHNSSYDLGETYTDTDHDGHRDSREPFQDVNGNGTRDPALTVTDLAEEISGSANIGNNYNNMLSELRSKLPTPPHETFGGEDVESLSAKLRVKHGRVNVSGSATVGDINVTSNTLKETLNGTYVSDGFGGNAGTNSVHADNGYANGYDLGDGVVTFPVIDSGTYTTGGTDYPNYLQYLRQSATVISGNLDIVNGVAQTITGPNGSLTVDTNGNMTISGKVFVDGNITFGPSKSRITYNGNGTLVTAGSAYVHCDLLPKTNFPENDVLGLIARDRVELATGSGDAQLTMAIAMYAQHQIVSVKQNEVAGTMVASYYQMSNVPRL
ncbi:hypothetical protein LLG39_11585, partial [bacterium]|nr:hypothetical protein [bacterium]